MNTNILLTLLVVLIVGAGCTSKPLKQTAKVMAVGATATAVTEAPIAILITIVDAMTEAFIPTEPEQHIIHTKEEATVQVFKDIINALLFAFIFYKVLEHLLIPISKNLFYHIKGYLNPPAMKQNAYHAKSKQKR